MLVYLRVFVSEMGYARSIRNDGGSHEAGAVGLAGLNGGETSTGTGDLTSAVVTTATLGNSGGDERQDNSGLHCDRRCF